MSGISVIIPTWQHASSLERCLDSVMSQTRTADEIIVVDDGSTDNTSEVVKGYDGVTYLYQENQGAPVARNRGFDESSCNLVIFWDADVVARPTLLERLENELKIHPEASWAYSSFLWGRKMFRGRTFDANALRLNNYIHTTALIRRKHFSGFDPSLKRFQDWDLWLTMTEQGGEGVFVDEVLYTILVEKGRLGYSKWIPSILYRVPWKNFGWAPRVTQQYKIARNVIETKHDLNSDGKL